MAATIYETPLTPHAGELWVPRQPERVLATEPEVVVGYGDFSIAAAIPPELLEGYEPNPIADPKVRGLGTVCLRSVRVSAGCHPEHPARVHRMYTAKLDGYTHAFERTDPVDGPADYWILSNPGLTESIESRLRQSVQNHMSYNHPNATVISVASNGIGKTGGRYTRQERADHGLEAMGRQRTRLARALVGPELPGFGMGTSMGTVVEHYMSSYNEFLAPTDVRVNQKGRLWLSPAIVDPENIRRDMQMQFLPRLLKDIFCELVLRSSPQEVAKFLYRTRHYGIGHKDLGALAHQVSELQVGVPEAMFAKNVGRVPVAVVAGSKDVLAQPAMMARVQEEHPDNLLIKWVSGHGHDLPFKSEKACASIKKTSEVLVRRALQDKSLTS